MKKLLCVLLSVLFITAVMVPNLCLAVAEDYYEPQLNIKRYGFTVHQRQYRACCRCGRLHVCQRSLFHQGQAAEESQ